jgi:hypothetical protein
MESEMERNKDIIEISSKLITLMDEHGGEYFLVGKYLPKKETEND